LPQHIVAGNGAHGVLGGNAITRALKAYSGAMSTGAVVAIASVLLALALAALILQTVRLARERRRVAALEERWDHEAASVGDRAAQAERTRIAREMHDVVAHTLSVVVALGDGGRFAAASDPQAATHTLATIADVSRSALAEMRALLGVLRDPDGEAPLGPQPSLSDIPTLVATTRDEGLEVSLVTTGSPHPLALGTGHTAYRMVQESLTNVRRHAGPGARAFVHLAWGADALTLTVSDDGRGAAAHHDGHGQGLLGMQERVALLGGSLLAGPRAGGGFSVRMHLPVPAAPAAQPTSPAEPATASDVLPAPLPQEAP